MATREEIEIRLELDNKEYSTVKSLRFMDEEWYVGMMKAFPSADGYANDAPAWIMAWSAYLEEQGVFRRFAEYIGYEAGDILASERKNLILVDFTILALSMVGAIAKKIPEKSDRLFKAAKKSLYAFADGLKAFKLCLNSTDDFGKRAYRFSDNIPFGLPDERIIGMMLGRPVDCRPEQVALSMFGNVSEDVVNYQRTIFGSALASVRDETIAYFSSLHKKQKKN